MMIRRFLGGSLLALAAVAGALAGCGPADGDNGTATGGAAGDAGEAWHDTTGDATWSDGAEAADGGVPVCLRGDRYVARGPVDVGIADAGGAQAVGGLRWHRYDGCERVVIDLLGADGGAAAGAGQVSAEVLRDLGVVRVALRGVSQVEASATDSTFPGPLARAAYAVMAPEGRHVYVDVHLGKAAEASVSVLADPARVVVDLRPGGGAVPVPAPTGQRVVVLEPRPGRATYPLTVTGYARTFEANVVVRLEHEGRDVHEAFTTATAWVDAWGHYSLTIPDGPAARVVLHVGEYSARDGTWEGVDVPLDMR